MVKDMADLQDKLDFLNKGFKNNSSTDNVLFLKGLVDELSADVSNFNTYKDTIPKIYKACMDELQKASPDVKPLLVSTMLKNCGISSTVSEEFKTQYPIFEEFLNSKSDEMIYSEVNELLDHAFDEKNKRIEVSTLINVAKRSLIQKEDNLDLLDKYIANVNYTGSRYSDIVGATFAFKELSESSSQYNITENQQNELNKIIEATNNVRKRNADFDAELTAATAKYRKFFFSNDLDFEGQIHKMKEEENLAQSAGFISNHPISTPIKDVVEDQKNKKNSGKIDVEAIEWEKKYQDYLRKVSNYPVKIMSSSEKFTTRFAAHGFAPKTASLFGDSIVVTDKYGDPTHTLWNVSPLTGTMRLSRDVNYHDPEMAQKAFAIAALNARRQGWDSVFLNHPGPDQEAKNFMEQSIRAMVEVGNYSFDQIEVPRKYKHILEVLKDGYAVIENGNAIKKDLTETPDKASPVEVKLDPADEQTPEKPVNKNSQEENSKNAQPENAKPKEPSTVIPDAFDADALSFNVDAQEESNKPVVDIDSEIDNSVKTAAKALVDRQEAAEQPQYAEDDIGNIDLDYDIELTIPEEMIRDHLDSINSNPPKDDTSDPKPTGNKRPGLFKNQP